MGANIWRHVPALEKMNNDTLNFYLSAMEKAGKYYLTQKSLDSKPITQQVDLREKITDDRNIVINGDGNIIDTTISLHHQVCFVSDPLENNYEINGSFISNLNFSINKKDMDITIRLYQQLPDGRYFQLSNNVARCSYAPDPEKRKLLSPGKPQNIYFDKSFFTSRLLQKGSRIVLLIGVNNSPYWQINYGTGKDVSTETIENAKIPIELQWFTGTSYIQLPVWK